MAEKLADFNNRPFRKRAGSRAELFQEEKLFLSALPQRAYELSEWHTVVAGLNYHICIDHQYYSVPYEYARQELDARMTRSMVEVFFEGSRICYHCRLHGAHGQYSTCVEHMPPQHREYLEWNGARFRREACMVGPETERVVEYLLTSVKAERQGYRSCANLLKLREKYTVERLEAACKKVLRFTAKPSYKSVLEILRSGLDKDVAEQQAVSTASSAYGFVRGAEYFGKEDE